MAIFVVGIQCEIPQRAGGEIFLLVVSIAHQRHERRDATGLCDGNSVVVIRCEIPQRVGGETFLHVVPIAHKRQELGYVIA